MTRVLVAVESCWADRRYHGQILSTWAAVFPGPEYGVRLFMGRHQQHPFWDPPPLGPWEVALGCGDGRRDLPEKTRAICRWALEQGFDWTFKCDTDTYVHLVRLLEAVPCTDCGEDYVGSRGPFGDDPCAYGGSGYWLSKRAMEFLSMAVVKDSPAFENSCEDFWVGRKLRNQGVLPVHDDRYSILTPPLPGNPIISYHPQSKEMLDPAKLAAVHSGASQIVATKT